MKQTILIVDDEALITCSLSKYLAKQGFKVSATSSPEKALSLIENKIFDIVITDLRMVPVPGTEIIRHLRRFGFGGKTIVMSAHFTEFEKDLEELKVDAFVEKPFELSKLLEVVRARR